MNLKRWLDIPIIIKDWPFLDKNRYLGQLVINILQKQSNEDFFIQLNNAWLHFTILSPNACKRNS